MTLDFYINTSDNKAVNKNLSGGFPSVQALPSVPCDVVNPTFILESNSGILSANYCYCDTFDRWYFVQEHTMLDGHRQAVKCKVDPLYTYRNNILNMNALVVRSENAGINFVPDNLLPLTPNKRRSIIKLSDGVFNLSYAGNTSLNFVLNVSGGS